MQVLGWPHHVIVPVNCEPLRYTLSRLSVNNRLRKVPVGCSYPAALFPPRSRYSANSVDRLNLVGTCEVHTYTVPEHRFCFTMKGLLLKTDENCMTSYRVLVAMHTREQYQRHPQEHQRLQLPVGQGQRGGLLGWCHGVLPGLPTFQSHV